MTAGAERPEIRPPSRTRASGSRRPHSSGFVAVVGRTGVGKSTLVNALVGAKVSITSRHPHTTRTPVRGVLNRDGAQAVFVDTPGFHRPRSALGTRLNRSATASLTGVDVVIFVVDAAAAIGPGDRRVASLLDRSAICVVNKIDAARPDQVILQLTRAAEWDFSEYFPVSATSGRGIEELSECIVARLPEGPAYYASNVLSDTPEAAWVAELVREQLLLYVREELPHSVACRVAEWDWPRIRCEIVVERESQKGIVIGHAGEVLKKVGSAVRRQLPEGAYLDLNVSVEKNWQSRNESLDRLGYGIDLGNGMDD